MEVLKFTLSGKNAMFKKPDVNTYYYFTYGSIHKIALLGIFGAILGYAGYGKAVTDQKGRMQFGEPGKLPEFYRQLEHLNIGIMPAYVHGQIPRKMQVFNNSVGYASQELGGNLIVKEQWLENPSWVIYLLLEGEESEKIAEAILKSTCVFLPYLGKNDHFADIRDVQVIAAQACGSPKNIHNLFLKKLASFALLSEAEDDEEEEGAGIFKYEERLPLQLRQDTLLYHEEQMVYTNQPLKDYRGCVWSIEGKNIAFY